jgi:hypothetical protein
MDVSIEGHVLLEVLFAQGSVTLGLTSERALECSAFIAGHHGTSSEHRDPAKEAQVGPMWSVQRLRGACHNKD